jgi:uncharacterized membrane protein YphA (DoxX/SURF4 family)
MPFLTFALDCYFAAMLGIAGLAKLDNPAPLAATLRRQRLLPAWSVGGIRRFLPWCEILLAATLVIGVAPVPVAALVLLLCAGFLAAQALLLWTKSDGTCGCYGAASAHPVEGVSVAIASLLLFLAGIHLWLAIEAAAIAGQWRLAAEVLCAVAGSWLGWRTWQRRRAARCPLRPALLHPQAWIRSRSGVHPTGNEALRGQRAEPEHAGEYARGNPM